MAIITSLYAMPLVVLYTVLTARVITYRRAHKLGLGDHGDAALLKRMRAQANFAEFVPFGLLLMLLVELQNAAPSAVHLIGGLLVLGRLAHGYGFSVSPSIMALRVGGTALTLLSYSVSLFCLFVFAWL